MALLKDTLITGSLTATNMIRAQTTLMSPNFTTYSSSTKQDYGVGADGLVLRSDGTDSYWSTLSSSDISGLDNYLLKTGGALTGTVTNTGAIISTSSGIYETSDSPMFYFLKSNSIARANILGAIFMNTTSLNGTIRPNKFYFRHYSYNSSTGAAIYQWDLYYLPEATAGKESNDSYKILTEKDAVTVGLGGTSARTPAAARANLGASPYVQGMFYGTCSTELATQEKAVILVNGEGFTLTTGVTVSVKFTNASAAATMTMKISNDNGTNYCTAKKLCRYGTTEMSNSATTTGWRAGSVVTFVYDGIQWERIFWENTTYTLTEIYCNTAASEKDKTSSNASYYYIGDGTASIKYHHFEITMRYSNTAQDALTLNINGQGAKPIYINGTASSATNYTLPRGKYIVYYDGTKYYFRTDGKLTANITGSANRASYISQKYTDNTVTSADYRILFTETSGTSETSDVTASTRLSNLLYFNPNTGRLTATSVANAIWNDYAEYRTTLSNVKPGQVVADNDDGSLYITNKRLIPGAQVVSDTWGHIMGETEAAKTPIAVAGRVLVYTYLPRENYHAGMAVCSAPNGTVDIMTQEEISNYPNCIIGIVSEIPTYKKWGTNQVDVDNRIWIKIK